jgi:hypothetical protein
MIRLRNRLKIGCDLDDTIFGFSKGYLNRFKKWPKYDWAITRNVTNILINERDFWINLPVIRRPNFEPKLYCSSRVNKKCWTKKAIEINDLPNSPLYQVPGYNIPKSKYIKGRIDVFIEDSPHQWKALNLAGIPCLLIDSPNNKELGPILKIYSLDYDEIEDAFNLASEMDIFKKFNLYYDN